MPLACAGCTTSTTSAAATSSSSAGATPTTPRAAARSGTSRRWPPASSSAAAGSRSSAPRTRPRPPTRSSTASASCAAARSCRSTLEGCWRWPAAGSGRSTSSSTSRTGCRSSPALVTRAPVVVLVHHVHREQWPVVYPGRGRPGGLVDRAPARAVALPALAVRRGLARHPRRAARRSASAGRGSRSCTTAPTRWCHVEPGKAADPTVAVVGRLVPHKQVEHAIDAVAGAAGELPELRLHVVGSGWWEARAARLRRARAAPGTPCRLRGSGRRGAQARDLRAGLAAGCCPRSRRGGAW